MVGHALAMTAERHRGRALVRSAPFPILPARRRVASRLSRAQAVTWALLAAADCDAHWLCPAMRNAARAAAPSAPPPGKTGAMIAVVTFADDTLARSACRSLRERYPWKPVNCAP